MELISGDHTLAPERYIAQQVNAHLDALNTVLAEAKARSIEVTLFKSGGSGALSDAQNAPLRAAIKALL